MLASNLQIMAFISSTPMAAQRFALTLSLLALTGHNLLYPGEARTFTITNECNYMVWPAVVGNQNPGDNMTGFSLRKGESKIINLQGNWRGKVWGRTLCSGDPLAGKFTCQTGDCGSGTLNCSRGGNAPLTVAEFSLQTMKTEFYDISLVDGFNLPMNIVPHGGTGPKCSIAGCQVDLNSKCPEALRFVVNDTEDGRKTQRIDGCKSACDVFQTPESCCLNSNCHLPDYTLFFAKNCPQASSYSFDDTDVSKSCNGTPSYTITFCPPVTSPGGKKVPWKVIVICISVSVTVLVLRLVIYFIKVKKKTHKNDASIFEKGHDSSFESMQCSLGFLQVATNNFSHDNMIGKGGFGVVYKGTLPSGQHIAIKKLLKKSGKLEEEFKNEMRVVAKLQHRNLVKLWAFCLEGDERILVFEYVPNKSLDYFIFDSEKQRQLDWPTRFKIIVGIARGLLYLHEDSRLRIIHRDLKPSNILLDMEMNPKIADFGMARIFGKSQTPNVSQNTNGTVERQLSSVDQTHHSTSKVGGTWGYIAPEYAQTQQFSVRTDVYSFGVIILEIISGKRNSTFQRSGLAADLLSYAWMLWREGTPLELLDATLRDSYSVDEVTRCIHMGLLCVQKDPNARPTMTNIVHIMLNASSTNDLLMPQSPASFALDASDGKSSSQLDPLNSVSVNVASVTELYPR